MTSTVADKVHAPLPFEASNDGALLINGISAASIAARHDTPVFAYDKSVISGTIASLRAALPKEIHLHYAVKANPFGPVVSLLANLVDGLDVASQGELELVRSLVGLEMPVSFAGPGKRSAELAAAIDLKCCVNLESIGEMHRFADIARQKGVRGLAAVRVNPPFDLRGSGMRMGGGAKPFGIDDTEVPALFAQWPSDCLDFQGFHIFTGSQSLSAQALGEAHANALQLALDLSEFAPNPPHTINMGGGLGVPYFPGDTPVDLSHVGQSLRDTIAARQSNIGQAKLILELGRYMVAEAGVYLTRVIDKKTSRGSTFLITDGGLHHQLAVSGNFGQVFRKNYPVAVARDYVAKGPSFERVTVVGCLCTPLDRLGDDMELPLADVGDVIAVMRCGAYGPTASPSAFLSHPACAEELV
ncbi:MAG: pyridoxal-dependent decarboxylase, exosortase A system-associated [Pseudomonadota bacterium]